MVNLLRQDQGRTAQRWPPRWLAWAAMVLCLWLVGSPAHAIPATPAPVNLAQPDGTRLTLRVRGDEYFHWYEDGRGFTVLRDAANQWVYGNLDGGGHLAPTAIMVGKTDPKALGLSRGILPSPAVIKSYRSRRLKEPTKPAAADGAAQRAPQPANGAAPTTQSSYSPPTPVNASGIVRNLVVLCRFADHVDGTHTRAQADYDVLFNSIGGHPTLAPTGSVRDYYRETSYGVLDLQSTVVAWVTLPQSQAYYADGTDGTGGSYPRNAQGMVGDALDRVDPLVNFADFDADNDGYIDSITVIHSGYGAETGGGNGNWIWSHRWSLGALPGGLWTSQDTNAAGQPVKVFDYHTEPALSGTSGTGIVRIGVICHETGHYFGLPDLYDTDGSSEGVGSWCLMANAWGFDYTQLHPPHFSAWCKSQLGWVTPVPITSGTHSIGQVQSQPIVYQISAGFPAGEYLLVENRQPVGFESVMPQGGLAVWHVDLNKPDNNDEGYPGQVGWPGNNKHYQVALLQADGLYQMEKGHNRGDAGDVYHGGAVSGISQATVPSTAYYQNGVIGASNHSISAISASGTVMDFTLNGSYGVPVIVSAKAVTAEPETPFSYQIVASDVPTAYDATGLPDGLSVDATSGWITGVIAGAVGDYSVLLSATNGFGTGTATLALSVVPALSLANALDTPGMSWSSGGHVPWTTQTLITHDGEDAAASGLLGDNQFGYVQTTVTGPAIVTFWWAVSSEAGYDVLRFSVDGAETSEVPAISGEVGWQQRQASLAPGPHTLRWQYSKDGSLASGADTAWLDEVVVDTTQHPPVITSVVAAGGALGLPFSYQIGAAHFPDSYGAGGLPGGLTLDSASGLISGTPTESGTFGVELSATNAAGSGQALLQLTIRSSIPNLAETLDQPTLTVTTAGDQPWVPELTVTLDGEDCAKSGAIGHGQNSVMQTTVTGPAHVSFWWKVSSEAGYDFLTFFIDGVAQSGPISGAVDWQQKSYVLTEGDHTLRWVYAKDGSFVAGSDCGWVDQLSLGGPVAVASTVASFDMETDPGWMREGEWAFGPPGGGGGNSHGNPDPNSGATGSNVFGVNLAGDYSTAIGGPHFLTTGPLDLRGFGQTELRFKRWLNTDYQKYVYATIEVSTDGTHWTPLFANNSQSEIVDNAWTTQTYVLGQAADDQAGVRVRWGHRVGLGGAYAYSGWNIDDVKIVGLPLLAPTFVTQSPLPAGTAGEAYHLTLAASGGTKPYTWSLVEGNLPVGLSLDGVGVISGTPEAGTLAEFTLRVSGGDGRASTKAMTLTITAPEIAIEQPAGSGLAGDATRDFGAAAIGTTSADLTFVIRNYGSAALTGVVVSKEGAHPGDFTLICPLVGELASAGGSTSFTVRFAPSELGWRHAVVRIASNDLDENPFQISLTGVGMTPLQSWLLTAGVPLKQTAPDKTPQHDGVTNLLKFAFNLDPTRPDVRHLRIGAGETAGLPVGANVAGRLRLEFLRRNPATCPGITYIPQFSSSVDSWQDWLGEPTVTPIDTTWQRVIVDDAVPSAPAGTRFARVKVVQDP